MTVKEEIRKKYLKPKRILKEKEWHVISRLQKWQLHWGSIETHTLRRKKEIFIFGL
ncbi:hypothetical protein LQK80_02565 [Bacillus thuringiensis]|nr:hypothetical protein [Bacillus thuringiensis]